MSKFTKFVVIISICQILSSIQGIPGIQIIPGAAAAATSTKPFVTEQFCKDSFEGRELEYCECHMITDAHQNHASIADAVKERCMKKVVSNYHADLFADTLKAQQDHTNGKIQNEAWVLKRRQNFQSYTTMCELIYSKAAGRAATCACDAYDYLFEGSDKRANCVHAASQLKANDVAKEEFAANHKPMCIFVASVTQTTLSMVQSLATPSAIALPILSQIPTFVVGLHAAWEFGSNPWTWLYGGAAAVVSGGVYVHQCVLA